jgi:Tfp pilus assembly protein PilO
VKRGPVIASLAGAAVILLMVVGLILPKAAQVRSKQQDLAVAQAQEASLQTELEQLQAAYDAAPEARERLVALDEQIPPTADLPSLIRLINTAALDSEVDFMSIAPGQPLPSTIPGLTSVPTTITINGSYFSVDQFLYRLETLTRINRVTTFTLQPEGDLTQTTSGLQLVLGAEFYTTDQSAGPGSLPGHSEVGSTGQVTTSTPAPTTTESTAAPEASPSPSASS